MPGHASRSLAVGFRWAAPTRVYVGTREVSL